MKRIMLALWIGLPALCFGRGQQEGGRPLSVRDSLPMDSGSGLYFKRSGREINGYA